MGLLIQLVDVNCSCKLKFDESVVFCGGGWWTGCEAPRFYDGFWAEPASLRCMKLVSRKQWASPACRTNQSPKLRNTAVASLTNFYVKDNFVWFYRVSDVLHLVSLMLNIHLKHEVHFMMLKNSVRSKKSPIFPLHRRSCHCHTNRKRGFIVNSRTQRINTLCWQNVEAWPTEQHVFCDSP
jgi:hypothetical protein